MNRLNRGDSIKIGYELGSRYYEAEGEFQALEGAMIVILQSDGTEIRIKESKIVFLSKNVAKGAEAKAAVEAESQSELQIEPQSAEKERLTAKEMDILMMQNVSKQYGNWNYIFEEQMEQADYLAEDVKKECAGAFHAQKFQEALDVLLRLKEQLCENIAYCTMVQYLRDAVARFQELTQMHNDGSLYYRGRIAARVEQNAEKSCRLIREAIKAENVDLKSAIYFYLGIYYVAEDMEKAAEVARGIIEETKRISPPFDQSACWKRMLVIFQRAKCWEDYVLVLKELVDVSQDHGQSCVNSVLHYAPDAAFNGYYEIAKDFYRTALHKKVDTWQVLLRILELEWKLDVQDPAQAVKSYLQDEEEAEIWAEIERTVYPGFLDSGEKEQYVRARIAEHKEREQAKSTGSREPEGLQGFPNHMIEKLSVERKRPTANSPTEEKWESEFHRYRQMGNADSARMHFQNLLEKDPDNVYLQELTRRAKLYLAQAEDHKKLTAIITNYEKGMEAWIKHLDILAAERLFINALSEKKADRTKALFALIDMYAVEYGVAKAADLMNELKREVRNCERSEKSLFYEKQYDFAILRTSFPEILDSLNVLQNLYYGKTQLGNVYYRKAECYFSQAKWKNAKESYKKSAEYGYMQNFCERKILLCRFNLGEVTETNTSEENITEDIVKSIAEEEMSLNVPIETVKKKVEQMYDQMQYEAAYTYVSELLARNTGDKSLRELVQRAASVVNNRKNTPTMPTRKDSQAAALRAWHIENNYDKAQKKFRETIQKGGSNVKSCIMDLSEMLMHVESVDAGIACLREYESLIIAMTPQEQTGFYEKMYLMQKKNKDEEGMLQALQRLTVIYQSLKKRQKVGFTGYRMGMIYYQKKEYKQAIDCLQKADKNGYHMNMVHQCIARSYIGLQQYEQAEEYIHSVLKQGYAMTDVDLMNQMNTILEQIVQVKEASSNGQLPEEHLDELVNISEDIMDMTLELDSKFGSYYMERCNFAGIPDAKREQENYEEKDIKRLASAADKQKLRERADYFQSAAYVENKINGNSRRYYWLLTKSVESWGNVFQNNGDYDSAIACYVFTMENLTRVHPEEMEDRMITREALSCILRQRSDAVGTFKTGGIKDILANITQIMDQEADEREFALRELILLLHKSYYLRNCFRKYVETKDYGKIWMEQIVNYLGMESVEAAENKSYKKLFEQIRNRVNRDNNRLRNFISGIHTSGMFDADQLEKLREFKDIIFVLERDCQYLNSLTNAYEKALEIYEYEDYDNLMATIHNVQNQFQRLQAVIHENPTYFGINFMLDMLRDLSEILDRLSKKTQEELGPELSVNVPITDVSIVDQRQSLSVTVSNKDNSASAMNVYLAVYDTKEQLLCENELLAPYLKGGKGVSKELDIASQGDTYTIRIVLTYSNHVGKLETKESRFAISSGMEKFQTIRNPYYTGHSIAIDRKEVFVGRDELLDRLTYALKEGKSNCEIIYGQKRSGKSSIANFLEGRLKDTFLVVKFSVGAIPTANHIYRTIKENVAVAVEDYLDEVCADCEIDEELLDQLEAFEVQTSEEFVTFIRFVKRRVCRTLKVDLLLILDEFTRLYRCVRTERENVGIFMDTWKMLLEADAFKAILLGQDTMPNFISEFQNQFQVTKPTRVDYLDDESARQLIEQPILLPNGESRFMENSVDMIVEWFHGQPFYLQKYCDLLVSQMNHDRKVRVTNALAEKVKERMLEESDRSTFDNLISRGDEFGNEKECYEILKQIAEFTRNSEWADEGDIQGGHKAELLEDLTGRMVLQKRRKKYKIVVGFFKEWLNQN